MQSSSNLSTSQYRYFSGIREPFYKCEYLKADDTAFSYDCYFLKCIFKPSNLRPVLTDTQLLLRFLIKTSS